MGSGRIGEPTERTVVSVETRVVVLSLSLSLSLTPGKWDET